LEKTLIGNLIVCTDILTIAGGIQRFNRIFYQAVRDIFLYQKQPIFILSLLDHQADLSLAKRLIEPQDKVIGYHGRKIFLVLDALRFSIRMKPERIFLTHVNFAPLVYLIRLISPSSQVWIVFHGFETWDKINRISLWGIKLCTGVLCVSSFTKDEFCKRNPLSPDKVHVTNLASGHEWDSTPQLQNDFVFDFPFILCVSRLEPEHAEYKGVDKTIEAVAALAKSGRLERFHLLIVGEGGDRSRLESLARNAGISDFVHFTGRISDDALRSFYANCEMFVLPSTKEGFGLVYLEAMAYGKPVIASQQGASKELVLDGQTGFLVPGDNEIILVDKISELIHSKPERDKLGEAGRKRYQECFSYQKFLERLEKALSS
jgi:phosphatidyl-myo-inositol dimannoside synthase